MTSRDYSDLSDSQLLDILRDLQDVILTRRAYLPVPMHSNLAAPSMLETALARQAQLHPEQRIAAHPQLLAAIVETSTDAISSRTLDGTLLTWNPGAERMYGYTSLEVTGSSHGMLIPEDRRAEIEGVNARLARGERVQDWETVRRRKDGSLIDVSINLAPILEHGRVVRVCTIARDITARKATERALQDALAREQVRTTELSAVLDAVPAIVLIAHDRACSKVTGNRAASELLKMPPGSNMSKSAEPDARPGHFRVCRDGKELTGDDLPVEKSARHGIEVRGFEQEIVFDDGAVKHLIGNAKPLMDQTGQIYGAVAAFVDISERKNAEEHIRGLAHLDPLTRLPNRTLLMDRLDHALAISQRNQSCTGVIFMDLDRFKDINDRLGHHVGDQLLQEVADRLRATIRDVDTVSRLGGDEFIIVLSDLHQAEDAAGVARKLLEVIGLDYVIAGQRLSVTPSLGISLFPDHGREPGALIRLADKAMYEAKQAGRNTWRFSQAGPPS